MLELKLKLCCGAKHRETGADASCVGCTTRCQCMKLQPEQDGGSRGGGHVESGREVNGLRGPPRAPSWGRAEARRRVDGVIGWRKGGESPLILRRRRGAAAGPPCEGVPPSALRAALPGPRLLAVAGGPGRALQA